MVIFSKYGKEFCEHCKMEVKIELEYGPFGTEYEGMPLHTDSGVTRTKECKCGISIQNKPNE